MSEGPYPEVPRITGPVLGITGAAAIGAEQRQRKSAKTQVKSDEQSEDEAKPVGIEAPTVLPDPLIEALDRLRTTDGERPAEDDILRLLRGRKTYQDGG